MGLFSDNQPTVSWVRRMASNSSFVAGQLVRALALRLKNYQALPLTPMHIAVVENAMPDIPSRSFGRKKEWMCNTDDKLLTMINPKFPPPNQTSWTVFRPSNKISTLVLAVLRMQPTTLDTWRRLPRTGRFIVNVGAASLGLWEWTLSFRKPRTDAGSAASLASPHSCGRDTSVAEKNNSKLERFCRRSLPLARQFPWPAG